MKERDRIVRHMQEMRNTMEEMNIPERLTTVGMMLIFGSHTNGNC